MKNGIVENSYLKLLKDSVGEEPLEKFNQESKSNIVYDGRRVMPSLYATNNNTQGIASYLASNIIPTRNISSSGTVVGSINGLPMDWILARERLVRNANILNDGWKINWELGYDNQVGRVYIYGSSYSSQTNKFLISSTYAVWKQSSDDALHFKSQELARRFINENQDDLQIYFSL